MAVIVKMTSKNFYKMHRFLTPDEKTLDITNENAEFTPGGGVTVNGSLATPINSAFTNSISEKSEAVKKLSFLSGVIAIHKNGEYANGTYNMSEVACTWTVASKCSNGRSYFDNVFFDYGPSAVRNDSLFAKESKSQRSRNNKRIASNYPGVE